MSRRITAAAGLLLLAALWGGPLPALAAGSFSAHMALHMSLVAVVAPLLAAGGAGLRLDAVHASRSAMLPVIASLVELAVVSFWHVPAVHRAARALPPVFWIEQGTFLLAGLALWSAALGGRGADAPARATAGVGVLVFTSMHMTLLGALFALAPRPLYSHAGEHVLSPLADQQLGGAIMILVGGVSYLVGGLVLLGSVIATGQRLGARG